VLQHFFLEHIHISSTSSNANSSNVVEDLHKPGFASEAPGGASGLGGIC
jgi:hypothetical protein